MSCVVVDRNDYVMEAEKQLSDKMVYKEELIQDLTETGNKIFRNLRNGGFIADEELKFLSFDHKRACNFKKVVPLS